MALGAPLAVNFQVMLRTLWNFVPEPSDKDKVPALAEVWQKDTETGEWRQELGAPAPEEGPGDSRAPGSSGTGGN